MKKQHYILIGTLTLVFAGVIFSLDQKQVSFGASSDAEIQKYIEDALIKGCKPVIDLCTSDCRAKDFSLEITSGCVPTKILKTDIKTAMGNYVKVAEKYGIKDIKVDSLPDEIRKEMEKTGIKTGPIKEVLK